MKNIVYFLLTCLCFIELGAQNLLFTNSEAKTKLLEARTTLLSADTSQFNQLIQEFIELEEYFFEQEQYVEFAQSFSDKSELRMRIGESREVIDTANLLLDKIPDENLEAQAILYTTIGYAQEVEGLYGGALESFDAALDLLEGFDETNYTKLDASLGRANIILEKWGLEEAENIMTNALNILQKIEKRNVFYSYLLARSYYVIGDLNSYKVGRADDSLFVVNLLEMGEADLFKSLKVCQSNFPTNLLSGLINNSIALNYWSQAKRKKDKNHYFNLSEKYYEDAIDQIAKYGSKKHMMLGRSENNMAMVYEDRWIEDLFADLDSVDRNLVKLLEANKYAEVHKHLSWQSIFEKHQNGYTKALNQYLKSLTTKLNSISKAHPFVMRNCHNLSGLLLLAGDYEGSINYAQQVININQNGFLDQLPDQLSDIDIDEEQIIDIVQLLRSLYWKSETQKNIIEFESDSILIYKKSKELLSTYDEMIRLLELMITGYTEVKSQTKMLNVYKGVYEPAIAVCTKLYNQTNEAEHYEKALTFIEKSKANLSRILIRGNKALEYIDPELAKEDSLFRAKIIELRTLEKEEQLSANKDQNKIDEYLFKQRTIKSEHNRFLKKIEKKNTLFMETRYEIANPSLQNIDKKIFNKQPSTALINFYVGEESVFIAIITKEKKEIFEIQERAETIKLSTEIRKAVFDENVAIDKYKERFDKFKKKSHELYSLLFTSINKSGILNNIEHLIFLPSGQLNLFPFELLVTQAASNESKNYSQLSYLLEQYNVSYAYALSSLEKSLEEHNKTSDVIDYLGFACSNHKEKDGSKDLVQASKEVESGQSIFGGKIYLEDDATETKFKNIQIKPRIIHLAMHTELDTTEYDASKFLFCDGKLDATQDDGYLHAYEIYGLADLFKNTELACLTACNTGNGSEVIGEGIMSLSNTFTNLNCKSVLMSLWPLSDDSSAEIMLIFLQNIKAGMSKSKALRAAKLKYLKEGEYTHPYYWSPLILTGNDLAMEFEEKEAVFGFQYWYLIFLVVIAPVFLLVKRKKKRV